MGFKITTHITVQWGDCDPAKIVFYPNYFRWMDEATTALFRAAGFPPETAWDELEVLGIPLVHAEADFRGPARFGDVLRLESEITAVAEKRIHLTHHFYNHGRLTVIGQEVRAWVVELPGEQRLRGLPVPDRVKVALLAVN